MAISSGVRERWLSRRWLESLVAVLIVLTAAWIHGGGRAQSLARTIHANAVIAHRHLESLASGPRRQGVTRVRPAVPKGVVARPSHLVRYYHVRWGDTLWALAQRFHTTVSQIEEVNHLSSALILAGSTLVIPTGPSPEPPSELVAPPRPSVSLAPLQRRAQALGPARPLRRFSAPSITAFDQLMIAHLVQAEAGNQPFIGQVAVAAVVLNRLRAPGFPKTVLGVIFAPGQFETVTNGTFWRAPGHLARLAVAAALKGWDPTDGALYFYNPSMPHAAWMNRLPETRAIGAQVFCR
ncbi:MAG: cell wall hydrolase [Firmicutes bacterium]|nr:cell wall hydrolase [Bacillota bacterium]